jgi:hypothetical protein
MAAESAAFLMTPLMSVACGGGSVGWEQENSSTAGTVSTMQWIFTISPWKNAGFCIGYLLISFNGDFRV